MKLASTFKKSANQSQLRLVCYKNGETLHTVELTQKKYLVGSHSSANLNLEDSHLSQYHAFIIIDEAGGTIIDLASENGSYINGEVVERAFFSAGDRLRFGSLEFLVEETGEKVAPLLNIDEKVQKLDSHLLKQMMPELPPLPGLVVIDGEYCDIKFDDEDFVPLTKLPTEHFAISSNEYIEQEALDKEIVDIKRDSKDQAIEVLVLSKGVVISVDYFLVKNQSYYASAISQRRKTVFVPTLEAEDDFVFFGIKNQKISLSELPNFTCYDLTKNRAIEFPKGSAIDFEQNSLYSFQKGTVQVMVRLVKAPAHLRGTPFFGRDRKSKAQMAKVFGAMMSLALLLLFVDISVQPPEKEIAVIYREALKAPEPSTEKASDQVADVEKDLGVKPTEQSQEAPKNAAKKTAQKEPKPAAAPASKSDPEPKAVAESAPAPSQSEPVTETKTYQFQMKSSMANLLNNNSKAVPTEINTASRSVAQSSGVQGSAGTSASDLKAQGGEIGTLGQDFAGDYDNSSGARGLASKKGIDTTYIDPKTVVLGSMDPELLRRILQEYLPQFRHCYQQELERQGDLLQGVIDLNFRIEKDGKVSRVDIKTKNAKFSGAGVNCMTGVLRMIDFPKPKGGGIVDVRQPLNFSSVKSRL